MMDKLPPIEKIYEAYSAIADGRVTLKDGSAEVFSSDRKKSYTVSFDGDVYSSNDNSTYWQGYAGYPVIAVLFMQGRLSFNKETADLFKDINWNSLNKEYKRDYRAAVHSVIEERGLEKESIEEETKKIYGSLKDLDIVIKRGKLRPLK
ncbi:MAG: hypothetical protein IKS54_09415 [Erysipelotrichaceae bacterium]|nr:hypothetical protein [Erysipelotrichaceae bacterium]